MTPPWLEQYASGQKTGYAQAFMAYADYYGVDGSADDDPEIEERIAMHRQPLVGYARTTGSEQTVYFEETSQFDVDAQAACLFVTCTYHTAFMLDTQHRDAIDSAHFWLNEGIVKLPTGMAQRYQEMAKRGQYFSRLAQRLNMTPADLDAHLVAHAISDTVHDQLLGYDARQLNLFAEAA